MKFISKARTLVELKKYISNAVIPDMTILTYDEFVEFESTKKLLSKISHLSFPVIVRSSSFNEDNVSTSSAGVFTSVLDVTEEYLTDSVSKVFNSYGTPSLTDELFIQPMLNNVTRSGVAFSHDPNTLAPYRVINWAEGEDTSAVTGGLNAKAWQQAALFKTTREHKNQIVIDLIEELLDIFDNTPLDIEFAITNEGDHEKLWLLQVRPLILSEEPVSIHFQKQVLDIISDKIKKNLKPHPFLLGKTTVYGVMPDWNPAEIIGIRPKPLALSLYREMITDSIWAYQRNNYGYRNLRSFPLMTDFFGLPYIDVRVSFNSFIPSDLDDNLANKLVDYYISQLISQPEFHDKVEFEIIFSCFSFDLEDKANKLLRHGFTEAEIQTILESLKKLTNNILDFNNGPWTSDLSRLDILIDRRNRLLESTNDDLEIIYWLNEDGKRYGTLPFAGLARAGFIAVQLLQSLVSIGILTQQNHEEFMESLSTISKDLSRDFSSLKKTDFIAKYGHLRPGTYDILSPRYDEAADLYFDWNKKNKEHQNSKPFMLSLKQMNALDKLLVTNGIKSSSVQILTFIQTAIEKREYAKFLFTKNVSDILSRIEKFGSNFGFSKNDLAHTKITDYKDMYYGAYDPKAILGNSISNGISSYKISNTLTLPPLIVSEEDVWSFEWPESFPNFITQKSVTASIVSVDDKEKLIGSIVLIPSADPGFDWVFSHQISGLITAYGGSNSHMAIRAGEIGLPAVIGTGELLYKKLKDAMTVSLDCAEKQIRILA